MNKKFYVGTLAFGVAASFWACGSGDILNPNNGDDIMGLPINYEDGVAADNSLNEAVMNSTNCPECFVSVQPSSSSRGRVRSSSSVNPGLSSSRYSSAIVNSSSSIPSYVSSSSTTNPPPSYSSSAVVVSSSSIPSGPISDIGTCHPDLATISKGGTATWVFDQDASISALKLLKAKFTWTFEGGTPPTIEVDGANGTEQKVKYVNSGKYGASVVVSFTDGAHVVPCSPLQVNGEPISCKCTGAGGDVTTDAGVATWTATCTSTANIIDYEWDGVSAGATGTTGTHTFTKKGQSYAPVLRVSNDDNSVETVTCPAIIASDANIPDYKIETTQDKVEFDKVGEFTLVADLPQNWHNDATTCTLVCQGGNSPYELTIDGIEVSGTNYQDIKGKMLVAHTVGKYPIPVKVTKIAAGETVSCGVNW